MPVALEEWKDYNPSTHIQLKDLAQMLRQSSASLLDKFQRKDMKPVAQFTGGRPPDNYLYDRQETLTQMIAFLNQAPAERERVQAKKREHVLSYDGELFLPRNQIPSLVPREFNLSSTAIASVLDVFNIQPEIYYKPDPSRKGPPTHLYRKTDILWMVELISTHRRK